MRRRGCEDTPAGELRIGTQYILGTSSRTDDERVRILKHADTFAVLDRYGDIGGTRAGDQGLYHEGTRFVSRLEVECDGMRPLLLSSGVREDNELLVVDLTNADVYREGHLDVPRQSIHLLRSKFLRGGVCYERLRLRNHSTERETASVRVSCGADLVRSSRTSARDRSIHALNCSLSLSTFGTSSRSADSSGNGCASATWRWVPEPSTSPSAASATTCRWPSPDAKARSRPSSRNRRAGPYPMETRCRSTAFPATVAHPDGGGGAGRPPQRRRRVECCRGRAAARRSWRQPPAGSADDALVAGLRAAVPESPHHLLVAAAVVSLGIGAFDDVLFIAAVLLINAVIGTTQEWRAERSARALQQYVEARATVRRDGRPRQIPAEDLVPGDIVRVAAGSRVPADLRLLSAVELQLDESLLTGESTAVPKQAEAQLTAGAGIADRANMLHAGALVLTGRADAVVAATGAATVIGGIAAALATAPAVAPPLLQRLARFGRTVGLAMGVVVAVLALIQALQGAPADRIFFMAVALAVAAVPEGLPVAITVALSIASARMAARNVVVRLLPAIEGLGSCTLIASDKTGTLTRNELMVRRIVLPGGGRLTVSGEGYRPVGAIRRDDGADPIPEQWAALRRLAACGLLCNEAGYRLSDDGGVEHFGDTVDVALQALAAKLGLRRDDLLAQRPERTVIPFESTRRFAAAVHDTAGRPVAYVKGAVETVLPMCGDQVDRGAVLAAVEALARGGHRVLALAAGAGEGVGPRRAGAEDLDRAAAAGVRSYRGGHR